MGWYLIIPIGRRYIFLKSLGLSWERSVKYHRWCGFYSVILMLINGIFYVAVWIYGNGNPTYNPKYVLLSHNLVAWGCPGYECLEKQKLMLRFNMYGFTSLFLVLTVTGFDFSWVQ